MSWILDGQRVKAVYLGQPVEGVVSDSRVKYGGKVQYTVELDQPMVFPWSSDSRTRVLVDSTELVME